MTQGAEKYSRYFTYIKPFTKIPIVKTYGSTIFTLISIIAFIFFAIKPTIETIVVLQKKIDNAKLTLSKITQKASDLTQATDNYKKLDENIKNKIETAIPNSVDLRLLISTLEQSAKRYVATISALQIQPIKIAQQQKDKVGTVAEIDFNFNLEGNYSNIVGLLHDLKTSARVLSINRVAISRGSEGTNLITSITGKAYYFK